MDSKVQLSPSAQLDGIVRARRATAAALLRALKTLPAAFTESELAKSWLQRIAEDPRILPFGWYQPPPQGVSVLIGRPKGFERLTYRSLRDQENWPSSLISYSTPSIIYPYFSAVDAKTGMIGDFVGTFYGGHDNMVRDWIATVYHLTLKVAEFVMPGKRVSDVFQYAKSQISEHGGSNHTFSLSAGTQPISAIPFRGLGQIPRHHTSLIRRTRQSGRAFMLLGGALYPTPTRPLSVTHAR